MHLSFSTYHGAHSLAPWEGAWDVGQHSAWGQWCKWPTNVHRGGCSPHNWDTANVLACRHTFQTTCQYVIKLRALCHFGAMENKLTRDQHISSWWQHVRLLVRGWGSVFEMRTTRVGVVWLTDFEAGWAVLASDHNCDQDKVKQPNKLWFLDPYSNRVRGRRTETTH